MSGENLIPPKAEALFGILCVIDCHVMSFWVMCVRKFGRNSACWDLPCSSCSCRWRTCWRVVDVLLCADGGGVPSHLRELIAFIHLSVPHCTVCQSAESAHTQSLFERVNKDCVRPSAAGFINSSTLLRRTTHLSAPLTHFHLTASYMKWCVITHLQKHTDDH